MFKIALGGSNACNIGIEFYDFLSDHEAFVSLALVSDRALGFHHVDTANALILIFMVSID